MDEPRHFRRILWWGNLRAAPISQRANFARMHGFNALSIAPADIVSLLEKGETLGSIRSMVEDQDIALTYLDPVVGWLPDWRPGSEAKDFVPFLQAGETRAFEFAAGLGIDRMLTITPFPPNRYTMDELADHLGQWAETARSQGVTCVLEAMPMWGLRTFAEVVELRRRTGADNVRLLFDTWHYCRGGRDDAIFAALAPGAIDHVQIADGPARRPDGVSLFEECLQHRLPPGEGELPLLEILRDLAQAGHLTSVGPEVFSAEFDRMSPERVAERLMPAFERCVAAALAESVSQGGSQ